LPGFGGIEAQSEGSGWSVANEDEEEGEDAAHGEHQPILVKEVTTNQPHMANCKSNSIAMASAASFSPPDGAPRLH
jgi:hypothetical protein